jgi:hypothetical protein
MRCGFIAFCDDQPRSRAELADRGCISWARANPVVEPQSRQTGPAAVLIERLGNGCATGIIAMGNQVTRLLWA